MSDPFDITNFDSVLTSASPNGQVVKLSSTYNKIPNQSTACLLVNYILKFYAPAVQKSDGTPVTSVYQVLYEYFTSDTIVNLLTRLRANVFLGTDVFQFVVASGTYQVNYFDLMYLSKFLDVGGRINNVPEMDLVNINTYLYNANLNCASAAWFKDFLPQYAQVLRDRTVF